MPSRLGEPAHDGRPCSHPVDLPSPEGIRNTTTAGHSPYLRRDGVRRGRSEFHGQSVRQRDRFERQSREWLRYRQCHHPRRDANGSSHQDRTRSGVCGREIRRDGREHRRGGPPDAECAHDDQFGDITKDKNSTPVAKVDLRGGAQPPLHDEAPVRRHVDRHGSSAPTRQADDPRAPLAKLAASSRLATPEFGPAGDVIRRYCRLTRLMPGVSQERQMRDIMQTCRSGRDGVARSVLRRFFARGVKASMRGVNPGSRCVSYRPADARRTRAGACATLRRRKISSRSSSTSSGGVPVVRLASPARTTWRSSKQWPPNALARSPREGRLVLEPRAREGDRPLVARQGAKQDRYLGSHLSVCVPAARARAISAARAADAWHGATGIGETSTWRKREAARWITTVDTEARRFGLRSSVSATAPRRWCRGSSSTAPPPKTGSSPV